MSEKKLIEKLKFQTNWKQQRKTKNSFSCFPPHTQLRSIGVDYSQKKYFQKKTKNFDVFFSVTVPFTVII